MRHPSPHGHRFLITTLASRLSASLLLLPLTLWAQNIATSPTVQVQGSRNSVLGDAGTANKGVVTPQQPEARTVHRPGELLEAVPELVVSQHSGEGWTDANFMFSNWAPCWSTPRARFCGRGRFFFCRHGQFQVHKDLARLRC